MWNPRKVFDAFRLSLEELRGEIGLGGIKVVHVADRACEIFGGRLPGGGKRPSPWTFRAYVMGRKADPRFVALLKRNGVHKPVKMDRTQVLAAFRRAIEECSDEIDAGKMRPRALALHAHGNFCESTGRSGRKPAPSSFLQMVSGPNARAEIVGLLSDRGVKRAQRTRLDRNRLIESFRRAVERLGPRIEKGKARAVQIAHRAHEFYTAGLNEGQAQPSRHTFLYLIYGKTADPEIVRLLQGSILGS